MLPLAVGQALGWTLLHSLWQIALVALALAFALRLVRHGSPNLRYPLACGALLASLFLPALTYTLISSGQPPSGAGFSQHVTEYGLTEPGLLRDPPVVVTPERPRTLPDLARIFELDIVTPFLPHIAAAWLAGVVLLSLRLLGGLLYVERFRRSHAAGLPELVTKLLAALSERLGVRRGIEVLESGIADSPLVIGILRPVILLPTSALSGLSVQQLEGILAHELAHIRRYDYLVNLLQSVIETLLFYHPAVWWIGRRIRIERENACDDLAVAATGSRHAYARALAQLESLRRPGVALAATGGHLRNRVRRIIGIEAGDAGPLHGLTGLSTLGLVFGMAVALLLPQWVVAYNASAALTRPQLWVSMFGLANRLTADYTAPERISATGYIVLEERNGEVRRRITVRQDRGGEFLYEYLVDGVSRPVDEAALAWYRESFARGITAVFRSADGDPEQIWYSSFVADGVFHSFIHTYQNHMSLDFAGSRGEVWHDGEIVERDDPDFETWAEASLLNDIGMVTHFAAHDLIGSFAEVEGARIRDFAGDLLSQFEPTPRVSWALLELAGEIETEAIRAEMLLLIAPRIPAGNPQLATAFRAAAGSLGDAGRQSEVLSAAAHLP